MSKGHVLLAKHKVTTAMALQEESLKEDESKHEDGAQPGETPSHRARDPALLTRGLEQPGHSVLSASLLPWW